MTKKTDSQKAKKHKTYTPWHVVLADVFDYFIDDDDMEVHPFVKLGSLPLESDFIFIRKKGMKDLEELYPDFAFMLPYLGKFTVVEYKSPKDTLQFADFDVARAYRLLMKRKYLIDYDRDIHVISMASHFQGGYAAHVENNGCEYCEIEDGIYGHQGPHRKFYWMDLSIIGEKYPENFINLFSSRYMEYEAGDKKVVLCKPEIVSYILQTILRRKEQFMNASKYKHTSEFMRSLEYLKGEFLAELTPEERLAGLETKDILAELTPKDILAGLTPEAAETLRTILAGDSRLTNESKTL